MTGGRMAAASVMVALINPSPHLSPSLTSPKSEIHVVQKPSLVCCSASSSPSPARRSPDESMHQVRIDQPIKLDSLVYLAFSLSFFLGGGGEKRRMDGKGLRKAAARPLVKFSTSEGRWHDNWTERYVFTLRELQLSDLVRDGEHDEAVSVDLSIQKHAGFGFSIEGRIVTSLTWKCSSCFTPFRKDIDSSFNVWVLPSRNKGESKLPEIGGNDPSVVYVKPGSDADLGQLIQDTLRLTATMKDTCSKTCEKATPRWQYIDDKVNGDQMWSRLHEMRESFR